MTLVLRPVGRGNWRAWIIAAPSHILVQLEDRVAIGGVLWRIAEIRP
jgi:hypothetical protein